jgi:hypothetical protein
MRKVRFIVRERERERERERDGNGNRVRRYESVIAVGLFALNLITMRSFQNPVTLCESDRECDRVCVFGLIHQSEVCRLIHKA